MAREGINDRDDLLIQFYMPHKPPANWNAAQRELAKALHGVPVKYCVGAAEKDRQHGHIFHCVVSCPSGRDVVYPKLLSRLRVMVDNGTIIPNDDLKPKVLRPWAKRELYGR